MVPARRHPISLLILSSLISSDSDLWHFNFKFAPQVTPVQSYVSIKFELSMAFLFQVSQKHGRIGNALNNYQPPL